MVPLRAFACRVCCPPTSAVNRCLPRTASRALLVSGILLGAVHCSSDPEPPATDEPPSLIGGVEFSEPSRTFEGTLEVTLTAAGVEGEIRYTTDGSPPTALSLPGDAAITVTSSTTLRAQIFKGTEAVGEPSSAWYLRRTFDAQADIPIVVMEGFGGGKPPDKENWLDLGLMMFEPDSSGMAALSNPPSIAARAGYRRRGQSSSNFPKTPYRVELWDNNNKDLDYPLLGMPSDSDWAFIGPCSDRSLVRNAFVYSLATELGLAAMQLKFAEVYINQDGGPLQESDYEGVYAITQTIKNKPGRLNLKQLRVEDTAQELLSGGYIFKFDQAAIEEGEVELMCTGASPIRGGGGFGGGGDARGCWDDLELVDPDPANPDQIQWITRHLQALHNSLHETPIGNYQQLIDLESFVDHFLINEITRDVDAYIRSHYMHKDRDGLIKAGPVWDYNFALGNVSTDLEGFHWEEVRQGSNDWHRLLGDDPSFQEAFRRRYQQLRPNLLSDAQLSARVDAVAAPLLNAGPHDLERWPVGECADFNGFGGNPTIEQPETWSGQIQVLKIWTQQRMAWLDTQWL